MIEPPPFSIVISTVDRPEALARALLSVAEQSHRPRRIVIVDASRDDSTRSVCVEFQHAFNLRWQRSHDASAARQRNAGATHVETPLIAFMDDDVVLEPDVFARLCEPFARLARPPGGVAGRIRGLGHGMPRGWLRRYYRLQAGFGHADYGALVFGPAINTLPCYENCHDDLICGDWLNSTCVVYDRDAFARQLFPDFAGYSFMEDVHLSLRVGRSRELYFHRTAEYEHRSQPSEFKRDHLALARSRIANQRIVARDLLGLDGITLGWKFALHRLFITTALLRGGGAGKWREVAGTWI